MEMDSLFVRSLALSPTSDAHCVINASRTTADGTFAFASVTEGVIRVYAASCAALLHEFTTIHPRIHALHYTSFSDSLVTLESDLSGTTYDKGDEETFLCVYHDWRERKMVRGYTLPLGVLETPSSNRKADCVAVCSFTGRVVVAMGTVLNIWQCSQGFFEHIMEVRVDMSQQHAYLQVEYVAIHGIYVAYASQTEVRVMETHVRSTKETPSTNKAHLSLHPSRLDRLPDQDSSSQVPDDSAHCISVASSKDLDEFIEVSIPLSIYSTVDSDQSHEHEERRFFEEREHVPVVLGRNEAQQEAWNLAGLIKSQDIRVNQAMSYYVREHDVRVLLQRYLPPNHCVQSLKFLPETIDNRVCVEARSYTRLLVATERNAFLYYFLSEEADSTRKKMSKKVFGKGERTKSRGMHQPIKVGKVVVGRTRDSFTSLDDDEDESDETIESGRVVMHYAFTSPVSSITANSSFLFVATLSGLQVWSIWSPCHYVAASRALSASLVPQPAQPQLLCTQPIPFPASEIVALDSYVILLPQSNSPSYQVQPDFIRMASGTTVDRLPEDEFELRRPTPARMRTTPSILIFQQSPPSLIFSYVRQGMRLDHEMKPYEVDLLLSLFSLYRYRADVGFDLLKLQFHESSSSDDTSGNVVQDKKEKLALELETKLYDALARECASDLASIFVSEQHRNLTRAALLFVASNVPSTEVMLRLQAVMGSVNRSEVIEATGKYLEAFVFPSSDYLPSVASYIATSSHESRGTEVNSFTRSVLLHYDKYAPEQLSRLIIDSALEWTLADIEFGLEKLAESTSQSVLVKVAALVLLLRATSFSVDEWESFKSTCGASSDQFLTLCSYDSMAERVKNLLSEHPAALDHLIVTHPYILAQGLSLKRQPTEFGVKVDFTSSILSQVLLEQAPLFFLQCLEQIFKVAVGRQEDLRSALLFCISIVGEVAEQSAARISLALSSSTWSCDISFITSFTPNLAVVVRFLVFVLHMFPNLERLAEREEIHEDEDDLKQIKRAISMELIHLCVKLSSCFQTTSENAHDTDIASTLTPFFENMNLDAASHGSLADWVQQYLQTRCLTSGDSRLNNSLWLLFNLALQLLHEKDLIRPQDVLVVYTQKETERTNRWKAENNLATLIVLLSLPRVSRTVDGLQLIAERADFIDLFLPYGKSFCVTLDEWRFLIETLSSMGGNTLKAQDKIISSHDRTAILESILNHVCSTLGPEDLLQVLPDDGDLALYMATIEISVQLDEMREHHRQNDRIAHAAVG